MPQKKVLGNQLNIVDVSDDISTNSSAISSIATGLTSDVNASTIIDNVYVRRDGTTDEQGTTTFVSSDEIIVTLAAAQPDTSYRVFLGPQANETFWYGTKTTTSFTIYSSNPSSIANIDWKITRD